MSRTERIRRNRRRRVMRNRRIAALCSMAILTFSGCALARNYSVQAQKPDTYKYYTDVTVQKGDTLWDLAMKYMTEEYSGPEEYIREVKKINHLGAQLDCGQILVLPYYSDEIK